jgi:hypothetical protein
VESGLKQDRLWISLWVFGWFVLLCMRMCCAASDAQSDSEALVASPLRAASRDRMRFFALALLYRKR